MSWCFALGPPPDNRSGRNSRYSSTGSDSTPAGPTVGTTIGDSLLTFSNSSQVVSWYSVMSHHWPSEWG
jgi:hypothetical protein